MPPVRRLLTAVAALCAALALSAAPANAVVGGQDASPGEYPAVAHITFGAFQCTGTLIDATHVLSAGHCASLTGAGVASPAAWPTVLIDVRIGNHRYDEGGETRAVRRVTVSPGYLGLSSRNDLAVLELSSASALTPAKVVGASERSLWSAGTIETIAGWGVTSEGGDQPDVLQEGQVPITTDAYCSGAYGSSFDAATMVCAGYPEGGVDTCQGDSGGPMFGRTAAGELRVVGVTSFGEGCARPGKPGVYARVGEAALRQWIASQAPAGVSG